MSKLSDPLILAEFAAHPNLKTVATVISLRLHMLRLGAWQA